MGYDSFKIVQQRWVKFQRPPNPPREGRYAAHKFPGGASGLFGEEAPGRWLSATDTIERYRRMLARRRFYGSERPGVRSALRRLLAFVHIDPGWHDTHARHSSVRR
jgi:hypothetical protein